MSKEFGLYYPDGSFKTQEEIRSEFASRKIFDETTEFLQKAKKLEGKFEVGVKEAVFCPQPQYPDAPIAVWHATDLHYGSIRTDYDLLVKHLKILEETPNFYVVFNGDEVDNFNTIGAWSTGVYEDPIAPQRQTQAWIEKIKELGRRRKIAVMSFGNHNNFTEPSGYDWLESFAREVKTNIFTSGGLLRLVHGEQHYPIAITHYYWGNCLPSTTRLLVITPNGITEMYLKDIIKIYGNKDGTFEQNIYLVGLDGKKVRLLRWVKKYSNDNYHIKFKDGLEVTCSAKHKFLTTSGIKLARELSKDDVVQKVKGVNIDNIYKKDGIFNYDYGWVIGLYIAKGSKSKKGIRFDIHKNEVEEFLPRITEVFAPYGVQISTKGKGSTNGSYIFVGGKIPQAIIETFVRGNSSYTKRLTMEAFSYGREFLRGIIDGWLDGDGHFEKYNKGWDAKICRNRRLAQNLRTLCWIVGYSFRLTKGHTTATRPDKVSKERKFFRIKIRKKERKHYLRKEDTTIEKINHSKHIGHLYDIEVEGELFCLTNGAVSHNSKLNPTNMGKRFWEHEYPDAEVILLGHTHQSEMLHWERGGKERLISIGGTYKQDDRWARQHGIGGRSGKPGHTILFFPYEHKFIGFKRIEDARNILLKLLPLNF